MNTYTIQIKELKSYTITVVAKDEEEAVEQAFVDLDPYDYDWVDHEAEIIDWERGFHD